MRKTRSYSRAQRLGFVFALLVLLASSSYSALSLLSRVTPALFPGHTLPIPSVLADLPGPVGIVTQPNSRSVFNRRINIVVMGMDLRPYDSELDGRTDSLMVVSIDPMTKQTSVLSIPRDMNVDIHPPQGGQYEDRINASFGVGANSGNSVAAGAAQLEKDLKLDFGIEIDYWVWLDIRGVEKLVDALGGIDVVIPPELSVPSWYYTDDDVTSPHFVAFPPGPQHLDGYNAVAFGRYRNDSDLYRMKRQQLVLKAALEKIFANGLLNNPLDLWNAYGSLLKTDVPTGKMPGYALLLQETQGHLNLFSFGDPVNDVPTVADYTTEEGASVLTWNPDNVQYWLSQAFPNTAYAGLTVEVNDATGSASEDAATAFGRYLKYSKGFPTVELGGALPSQSATAVVVSTTDQRGAGEDIAKWLGLPPSAVVVQDFGAGSGPDIQVVLGDSFKLPTN
jgi:LCP family protein required for cell wall assembly